MTLNTAPHSWGPPTGETAVVVGARAVARSEREWESKFSEVVDSICADYGTATNLPSFMSHRWD
jgi:hypothetical protein